MANVAKELKDTLNLQREPVGVKFLKAGEVVDFTGHDGATKSRYCQALMRAGQREKVLITAENISCPASAAAFGLKPLPEMLSSGKMLFNMGLFDSLDAGRNAMEGMTRLEQGKYAAVLLSPLEDIEVEPDIVVIEALPEQLMWLSLASIYETGNRLEFNTAVFQATCVDSTVIPFVTGKLNSSLGCYGCREATDALEEWMDRTSEDLLKALEETQDIEELSGKLGLSQQSINVLLLRMADKGKIRIDIAKV